MYLSRAVHRNRRVTAIEIRSIIVETGIEPNPGIVNNVSWFADGIDPTLGVGIVPVINNSIAAKIPIGIPLRNEVNKVAIRPPRSRFVRIIATVAIVGAHYGIRP